MGDLRRTGYDAVLTDIAGLFMSARASAAKKIDSVMTAAYWHIGRRIIEYEQSGKQRAVYGKALLSRLSGDLSNRFGRGFSSDNLESMRLFYLAFSAGKISETLSRKLELADISPAFPLSWSHYVRLVRGARSREALEFYHHEALRGGWTVRQLGRQINSQFYERLALSKNKQKIFREGGIKKSEDISDSEEEIKNPPVGIILCSAKGNSLVRYSTAGLSNKTLVREYLHVLPDEKLLMKEIENARMLLEASEKSKKK